MSEAKPEVQEEGTRPAQDRGKMQFWQALNSPFVLFFMSSVVLTGITQIYTNHAATKAAESVAREQQGRILLELEYRGLKIDADIMMIHRTVKESAFGVYYREPARGVSRAGIEDMHAIVQGSGSYQPTAPEFARIHLAALLQRADLIWADVLSEKDVPVDGAPIPLSALNATLRLEQASTEPDEDEVDDLETAEASLFSYVSRRRSQFLCGPTAPHTEEIDICRNGFAVRPDQLPNGARTPKKGSITISRDQ